MSLPDPGGRRLAAPFLGLAALCCLFAFVGLGVTSYWIDELFTLFVIDHDDGLGEVLSRALTDTHPPAYYFLAYGWIHALGSSEVSLRAFAALCAVGAVAGLFLVLKPWFSLPARAFAVLIAAASTLTFDYAQTARSYSLCVLISVGLTGLAFAIHARARADTRVPWRLIGPFWLLSLLASYTHFYLFLEVGGLHLFLLLAAPWKGRETPRFRLIVLVSGALLFAAMTAYVLALLSATRQDLQNMWFDNSAGFLVRQAAWAVGRIWGGGVAAIVVLALVPWGDRMRLAAGRPTPPPPAMPLWPLAMAGTVTATVLVAGLAVSLAIAPSFGKRNLLVFAPFLWVLPAWLWDAAAPDPSKAGGKALIAVLFVAGGINAVQLPLRFKPRDEDWRASAELVAGLPGCRTADIAVVQPWIFGPSTPFFRDLARRYFYGRYYPVPERLHPFTPEEFDKPPPELAALLARKDGCRVIAWGVHDLDKDSAPVVRSDLERAVGGPVEEWRFDFRRPGAAGFSKRTPGAWVWLRP
jgi:hypothetical protein